MIVDANANLLDDMPDSAGDYTYLINMQIVTFTKERVDALENQLQARTAELAACEAKTAHSVWRDDLNLFSQRYALWSAEFTQRIADENTGQQKAVGKKRKGRGS